MKLMTRLLGGAGASALAATALAVIEDNSGSGPAAAEPETEEVEEVVPGPDDEVVPPASSEQPASAAPAAAAPPAPAAEEEQGLTAEQTVIFEAGAASRNEAIAEVFSARVKGDDGKDGELVTAGREAAAAELLAAGLTAEQTIKTLGRLPKGTSGDAMLDALRTQAGTTPKLPPSGGGEGNAAKNVWDRAADRLGWNDKK